MRSTSQIRRTVGDLLTVGRRAGALPGLDASTEAQLQDQVVDALESGAVRTGVELLLARTPNPEARKRLGQLVDSALQVLGVDPRAARLGWSRALVKLGGSQQADAASIRLSPARDAFRGLSMPLDDATRRTMRRIGTYNVRALQSLELARTGADPVRALDRLFAKLDLSESPDALLMGLMSAYAEHNAWPGVIASYEGAPASFRDYPVPRRAYALALSMTGCHHEALKEVVGLLRDGQGDNVSYGVLGKIQHALSDLARADGDTPGAQLRLKKAIAAYREGFARDPAELYPGVALPALLEMSDDPRDRAEAVRFAGTMKTVAESRLAYGERQYWDLSAVVTLAVSQGELATAERHLPTMLAASPEPWMLRSTSQHLDGLAGVRRARGEDTRRLDALVAHIESAARANEAAPAPTATGPAVPQAPRAPLQPELDALLTHAYRFGGRSSKRLPGNYHLSGIAHDVRVTPADLAYFARILEAHGLDRETDPMRASERMDAVIRAHFGTAEMEDIEGDVHARFDAIMPGLARYMSAHEASSQTNVSADWIHRLADCRQHAPVKLMMFEAWKRIHLRHLMSGLDRASREGEPRGVELKRRQIEALGAWEMRILDAEIVRADDGAKLEEHTMTLLIHREPVPLGREMTALDAVYLADSFYHEVHRLSGGRVGLDIHDGKLSIAVPEPSKDGTAIALAPTPYSYDRSLKSVDFGQLQFRGIQVASPGWEREVPVEGLDLSELHDYVLGSDPTASASTSSLPLPP
jgi:hypothetical protein